MNKPIVFFLPSLNGGGAEKVFLTLAGEFVKLGDRPVFLVLARKGGVYLSDVDKSVNVVELGSGRVVFSAFKLWLFFMKYRPVAVYSTIKTANIVSLLTFYMAFKPGKIFVRDANVVRPEKYKKNNRLVSLFFKYAVRTYNLADKIVIISKDIEKGLLASGVHIDNRGVFIGNPVDVELKEYEDDDGEFPVEGPYICAVGRLVEQKGYDVLLEAFSMLGTGHDLVILGDGPLLGSLKKQAQNLGVEDKVHFLGFVKQPKKYIARSALFVMPSRWEGFPNSLMDAMSVGIPIVSTDCPGANSYILEGGKLGCLVPVDDVKSLCAGMRNELFLPTGSIEGRRARARFFEKEKITKKYYSLIE